MICASGVAGAGGLLLPGTGAISTSRAGAAIASADDGEALALNPAGLAKAKGTTITVSAAIINYSMSFTRRGTYDAIGPEDAPYEGTPYPTIKNTADAPVGIGAYQPVPVIAIVSDLGGRVPNLHVAAGVFAPNAYPFRDMTGGYEFNLDFNAPPPPTRYDVMEQDAAVVLPSVAVAYSVLPNLDLGARFSWGIANVKSTVAVWGEAGNFSEFVKEDSTITIDAKDNFVPVFAIGATYRPTPALELGLNYTSQATIHAKGGARSEKGPSVDAGGESVRIGPSADPRCATGGTFEEQKACLDFALPMSATLGVRYKFLGADGQVKGDLELDLGWEHWAADLVSTYHVLVDAAAYVGGSETPTLDLKSNEIRHEFKDVLTARLGGSYILPTGDNQVIVRGGLGYDTRAAKPGWLRADIDGAARFTVAAGAAYKMKKIQIDAGIGAILEGSPSNPGTCNPLTTMTGCASDGSIQPIEDRKGPDPINPLNVPMSQLESPINQGDYKAHYLMFMLGMSTWF
ncbi:MAG: outer membrane protein transport protein [Kofleriaceae bacterium]